MILYSLTANGSLRFWEITKMNYGLSTKYGVVGGSTQHKPIVVETNRSGRSFDEQCDLEMEARIKKRLDQGYCTTMEEARKGKTNALGLTMPMLAKPFGTTSLPRGFFVQLKFDGNRCLITKQDGKVFAYSRNGKPINSIDHILEAAADLPEGHTLDGELYHHGTPLQTIRSWIAKKQAASNNLVYMCYDVFSEEKEAYLNRLENLEQMVLGDTIVKVETTFLDNSAAIKRGEKGVTELLKDALDNGYEGLILRTAYGHYESKRSSHLVKVKAWKDEEFEVVDIVASNDGWAILKCKAKNGMMFRVSCHGAMDYKIKVYENRDNFIGKYVTVQYANLTKDGVPFHPVAIAFRGAHE